MDESPSRAAKTTATRPGRRLKLVALTLAVAAAGYLAFESPTLSPGHLPGKLSGAACDEAAGSDCTTPAAPDSATPAGRQSPNGGIPAGANIAREPAARPLAAPDAPAMAEQLRPGYTMAELCATIAEDQSYRCQTGYYDDSFIATGSGAPARVRSGHTISGRVLTADGAGLGGITIIAAPERLTGQQAPPSGTLRFWTVTDALGAYALEGLPDGEYTLRSRAQGEYPSARISARAGVDYADLVVSPGVAFMAEGKVVSASGDPLEGVTVLPVLPGQPSVLSSDDGRFRLPVTLRPATRAFAVRFQLPGFHEQTGTIETSADAGATTLNVVMQPVEAWTSVSGRVRSDSGKPLAGRTVELKAHTAKSSHTTTTDRNGRYAFPAVEAPADYRLIVSGGADHRDVQRPVHVSPDMGELDVVAAAYEFGAVTGQLVNLNGEPIPDFELVVRNTGSRQPNALVSTDEDGNFEIEDAPAGPLVVASQSTPSILVEGVELQAGATLHLPLVLDWGSHEIRGRVVDERGQPVPASRILLQWSHRSAGITTQTTRRTSADAQGEFAFTRLGPGQHTVQIDAPGFATVAVEHDVSRSHDLTVRLDDAASTWPAATARNPR